MAHLQPLPPHVHHTTTRLNHRAAHTMLSTFLTSAENNAAYRPDSTLSERGPISSSSGAATNLTLHHLKRILQGIEGKKVGGSQGLERFLDGTTDTEGSAYGFDNQPEEQEGSGGKRKRKENSLSTPTEREGKRQRRPSMNVRADSRNRPFIVPEQSEPATPNAGGEVEWQDQNSYEYMQGNDEVDVMNEDRMPGGSAEQPKNAEEAEGMMAVGVQGTGEKVVPNGQSGWVAAPDKEGRKRRKKERRKEEKRRAAQT